MTDKLREAAERALRWLDSETPTTVDAAYAEERAIAEALRAALAQQPEPVNVAGLSIAAQSTIGRWLNEDMDRAVANGANSISMPDELVEIAAWLHALAEPAQQPDPAQEPVAGAVLNADGRLVLVANGMEDWYCKERNARRLYAAPQPQRPPLTDAEMLDIIDDAMEGGSLLDLVRAIERKARGEA